MKAHPILILFLALTCLAQSNEEKKVTTERNNQPVEAPAELPAKPEIIISVLEDGAIKIEGILVSREELSKKLRMVSDEFADQPVRIRGDRKVPYGTIVDIIDLCQKAGIWKISFAASSK